MKEFTITFSLRSILFSVSGILLITIISAFVVPVDTVEEEEQQSITLQQAQQFYDNYIANRSTSNVDYVTISKEQYDALRNVKTRNSTGFRIFSARDESGAEKSIVIALEGGAEVTGNIQLADADQWDACPPTCDTPSQIAD